MDIEIHAGSYNPNWSKSKQQGETYLTCLVCGGPTGQPSRICSSKCEAANKDKPAQGHTPGPWRTNGLLIMPQGSSREIATVTFDGSRGGKALQEANARLIAAAPDLLAACKAADALLNDTTEVRKILRYAIARAEGRAQ